MLEDVEVIATLRVNTDLRDEVLIRHSNTIQEQAPCSATLKGIARIILRDGFKVDLATGGRDSKHRMARCAFSIFVIYLGSEALPTSGSGWQERLAGLLINSDRFAVIQDETVYASTNLSWKPEGGEEGHPRLEVEHKGLVGIRYL